MYILLSVTALFKLLSRQMQRVLLLPLFLLLNGCAMLGSTPPSNQNNICSIFEQKSGWYDDALDAQKKWGTPISVMMAIMKQESAFTADAQPDMDHILWIIPIGRPSSAYGYAQAQDPVWREYQQQSGNSWSDRDEFEDAIDFIGWYTNKTYKINKVSKWDANQQYLNYHEGWTGFRRGTYKKKAWLMKVAKRVQSTAYTYSAQLKKCEDSLSSWF
jgi:hypothetical protein